MTQERDEQHNRLTNPHRSYGTKKGWLRHHANYMRGIRKRERDKMNKTFYNIAKELEESMNLIEAKIQKDDIFDNKCEIIFDNMSGGISFSINKEDGTVSFSTLLNESGKGSFRLENMTDSEDSFKSLYEDLKDELEVVATTVDQSIKQILARHGLREA